ncbi:hnh endonuclease [Arthrobacter sp. Hiyo6]|nr:hnh endonuclease [Arthrobacter sp. Hiyo6]
MSAIIVGWNPDHWNEWNYGSVVLHVQETGQFVHHWSVGRRRTDLAGADAWLVWQGRQGPGLIGHGRIVSGPPPSAPGGPGTSAMLVPVAFDSLLPLGDQIAADVLEERIPGVRWNSVYGSGMCINQEDEAKIRDLWRELGPEPSPDPTQPVPGTIPGPLSAGWM